MAAAQEKFKTLFGDVVTPWLRERGFKHRDATFRRRREEAWQIVNLQRDKYSDHNHVRFTINLGVSLDVLNPDPPCSRAGGRSSTSAISANASGGYTPETTAGGASVR